MQRKIKFSVGEYYHLYNRGVEKRDIFIDDNDRTRFHRLLFLANSENNFKFNNVRDRKLGKIDRGKLIVSIGVYVLMPNHFHILVKEVSEGGISKFMEKLNTSYSMYFNKKHERVGPLFQGRFKGEHVDHDEYLKYLYAYIHLNPVKLIEPKWRENGLKNKNKAIKFIEQYSYSSYPDYCDKNREVSIILSKDDFPNYFLKVNDFKYYMNDWLNYKR